jgi:hypothetical protein
MFLGKSGSRTIFAVELTSGRARGVAGLSMIPSGAEVILPPNSRFTVVSKLATEDELCIVQLKELPPLNSVLK